MDTTENNKLIAEFMNVDQVDIDTWIDTEGSLKYNTSWDWLMPVVEKIENITNQLFEDVKYKQYHSVRLSFNASWWSVRTVRGFNKDKKLAYYEAVVEFIKWYNKKRRTNYGKVY
jgi:hypothetical protein